MKLTARPSITPDLLKTSLSSSIAALDSLASHDRQRLRLMSRWYRRAQETLNQIDKYLFLYTALEVYPALGKADVPNAVRDFLAQRVFSDVSSPIIKERLMLGQIAGFRAEVVHQGKSSISSPEQKNFTDKLIRLEALTFESMSLLAGKAYGGTLDKWVRV